MNVLIYLVGVDLREKLRYKAYLIESVIVNCIMLLGMLIPLFLNLYNVQICLVNYVFWKFTTDIVMANIAKSTTEIQYGYFEMKMLSKVEVGTYYLASIVSGIIYGICFFVVSITILIVMGVVSPEMLGGTLLSIGVFLPCTFSSYGLTLILIAISLRFRSAGRILPYFSMVIYFVLQINYNSIIYEVLIPWKMGQNLAVNIVTARCVDIIILPLYLIDNIAWCIIGVKFFNHCLKETRKKSFLGV